jgi:branched-subunit amino acid aminotransferase/4-amino-4-deoxychorismate lyase
MTSFDQRPFNKWDVYDAHEAFLIGSTTYVTAIVQWDGKDLGEGSTGDE